MARASTRTLLPLDRFAKIVGIHPLHFNQVEVVDLAPVTTCQSPVLQWSWQEADRVGREELAELIATAEATLKQYLGFSVAPEWIADEFSVLDYPRPGVFDRYHRDISGLWKSSRTKWGYVLYGGQEAKSVIEAGSAITYSDVDSDSYDETATVTVATTVTDPEEIAVYYPGKSGADEWEIRPITVVIAGGTATITFRREQAVLESLMENLSPRSVDGLVDANFLEEVDVYRHYNDPSRQARFEWEEAPGVAGPGTLAYQDGAMLVREHRAGVVYTGPGTYDAVTQTYAIADFTKTRAPDRVRLWYRAGWMFGSRTLLMDPIWERAVSYYALSLLDRPLCGCEAFRGQIDYWREDLSRVMDNQGTSVRYQRPAATFGCPLGTTRGAQFAWRFVTQNTIGQAVNNA